jgi:glucose-1-phosphate adenylyltransferase
MHADIGVVGVLTQYKPHSLSDHIGCGEAWGFSGRHRSARILPPYKGDEDNDWYSNTADAIWQNRQFIRRHDPDLVLILSGDHIYHMDYAEMIRVHLDRKADATIAVQQVPWEDTSRFGLVEVAEDMRVKAFQEKPKSNPMSNLASLGIYVFDAQVLLKRLEEDAADINSEKDFGKNILPAMLAQDRMYGHEFKGYWRDVGTIESFWQAHMELLDPELSGLRMSEWNLQTNMYDPHLANYFPAAIERGAAVSDSIIGRGCIIQGTVEKSVLFPGVKVGRGARITESVILPDTVIAADAVINRCIIDTDSIIDRGCTIGNPGTRTVNFDYPELLNCGISLIGENALLPPGSRVGGNVLLYPGMRPQDMPGSDVGDGMTVTSRVGQ